MKLKDIIILILILLVVSMSGYLVYDKVFKNDKCIVDNSNKIDNDNMIENNESQYIITDIDNYKNSDGSYGSVEDIIFSSSPFSVEEWQYNIKLSLDGNIYIYEGTGKIIGSISNINNAIDIHEFYTDVGDLAGEFYILTNDGDVYVSKLIDLVEGKYEASKLNGVSNVKKIMTINCCFEQGCGTYNVAVTEDNKIMQLSHFSV